ncbi:MAG: leucyl aminopeptidase [bacterium]
MTTIALQPANRRSTATALVVATRSTPGGPALVDGYEAADDALDGRLADVLTAARAKGGAEEVVVLPVVGAGPVTCVVAVGLGEQAEGELDAEAVRRGVGVAVRTLSDVASVTVCIGSGEDTGLVAAIAEGALLGGYTFTAYKEVPNPPSRVGIRAANSAATRTAMRRAEAVGQAMATIRDWVNTSPAEMYPDSFASAARALASEADCAIEVLDEKALRRGGYGGILGVGSGSARPPRLVRVHHRPRNARARIALVGKGITYDSGGYSLKVPQSGAMKGDMAGAATMVAAAVAAARLGVPVEVIAYAALAENLVSGTAYRVGDVLTLRGGRTVEVENTDAEGRLVLADAIVRAAEDEPDRLIEASTLTGAALIALGQRTAAVMGSEPWRDEIVALAGEVGEAAWPLPLLPDLRPGLDSPVADLRNVTGERFGGSIVAGLFLGEFVPDGLPWAHIDIAGPSFNPGPAYGYTPQGGTGFGLRTVLRAIESAAA